MKPVDPALSSESAEAGALIAGARMSEMAGETHLSPIAPGRLWVLALLAGLLAGLGAWLVGESGFVRFQPGAERVAVMGGGQMIGTSPRTRALAALQGAAASSGVFGGLLGLALGLAAGRARRPARWTWPAASVGLVLGATAGAVPPWIVIPLAGRSEDLSGADLGRSMLVHAALWVALGASAGLALGLGLGGRARAVNGLLGGALGALVGIGAYDFIGALAFPLAGTGLPIPATPATRLMARLLVALGTSAGAAALLLGASSRLRSDATTTS
jgi:hypothetical protein